MKLVGDVCERLVIGHGHDARVYPYIESGDIEVNHDLRHTLLYRIVHFTIRLNAINNAVIASKQRVNKGVTTWPLIRR